MIITQFMRAFPGVHVYISAHPLDAWEVCRIGRSLEHGMGAWLEAHNLKPVALQYGGYAFRWISEPLGEKKMVAAVLGHANCNVEDVKSGIEVGVYKSSENPEIDGDEKKLKAFAAAAVEAGLL